jgi:hypothetical protein
LRTVARLVAVVACACSRQQILIAQDEVPTPPATHYTRSLGPYSIDGQELTVKLSVICYKQTRHPGECNDDDEQTVKEMKIEDQAGKSRFSRSFPVAFAHQLERHLVEVTRLEGQGHEALELKYERLPSHANTGVSVQLFGVRDGQLEPFDSDPLHFYGELGDLPDGTSEGSRRLLPGNAFPIYLGTNYFYVVQPVTLNWENFRLEPQETGEFQIPQEGHYRRALEIKASAYIHLYASPDQNAPKIGVSLTPDSRVKLVSALFLKGPPDEHSSADDTWLKISVGDKIGWILGIDDDTAIGLTAQQ